MRTILKTFILLALFCLLLPILSAPLQAADTTGGIPFKPQVTVSGFTDTTINTSSIGKYIKAIYNYAIGIVGIVATIVIMFAGVMWITAGGNASTIGEAKAWIGAALTGLVLAMTSYLILSTINPDLLILRPIDPRPIAKMKICCDEKNGPVSAIYNKIENTYTCPAGKDNQTIIECTNGALCKLTTSDIISSYACIKSDANSGCCVTSDGTTMQVTGCSYLFDLTKCTSGEPKLNTPCEKVKGCPQKTYTGCCQMIDTLLNKSCKNVTDNKACDKLDTGEGMDTTFMSGKKCTNNECQ